MLNVPVSDYLLVIAHCSLSTHITHRQLANTESDVTSRAPVKVVEVVSRHQQDDEVQEEQEQRLIQRDQAGAPEWGGGHGGRGGR